MKDHGHVLKYDGTFNGFLTVVYTAFKERIRLADINPSNENQNNLFADSRTIITDVDKARKVWYGIEKRHPQATKQIYFCFLSEQEGVEFLLYQYIKTLFGKPGESMNPATEGLSRKVGALSDRVAMEKRQTEASVHFQSTSGNANFALINPRFNILPLITKYFRTRLPEGNWILYDIRRGYGLHYHHHRMEQLHLSPEEAMMLLPATENNHQGTGSAGDFHARGHYNTPDGGTKSKSIAA